MDLGPALDYGFRALGHVLRVPDTTDQLGRFPPKRSIPRGVGNRRGVGSTDDFPGNTLVSGHASGFAANGTVDAGDSGNYYHGFFLVICALGFKTTRAIRSGPSNRFA